jgi:predicted porin
VTTKGLATRYAGRNVNDPPQGTLGWLGGISSQSFVGIRNADRIGHKLTPQWQLETQIDVSASSGITTTNSNNSGVVKGGLTSRNSYLGIANQHVGGFYIGKTDAPYKNITARMNYASQTIGDYSIVMGNSGGDNRVEFGTRLDHSIWWNSPKWGDWTLSALVSPGQNRAFDQSIISSGSPDCAGGNLPGSGAGPPQCNDGAWRNVWSFGTTFTNKKLYAALGYEIHQNVNRNGDVAGTGWEPFDIANEDAIKVGGEWTFGPRLKVAGVYESLRRMLPQVLQAQNERTREGFFVALDQAFGGKNTGDHVSLTWARANPTPGDPGQHNTEALFPFTTFPATITLGGQPSMGGTPHPDNMANSYALRIFKRFDRNLSAYVVYADTINHYYAHYDLGAGGRGLTTDCHDGRPITAFDPTVVPPVSQSGPACFAGGHLQGVSTGIRLQF